ncbi:MAG TPA: LysR family transcriptional regulator [Solirubrobacteraceae bacterium]|jgi:DNA-binding transcriptional LysR family regulator|nr:LysR family transcriptional regulator [Solirubrobacteraceae bacterium]
MLDVKRLRVLREVAARGSFSAAADSLAYTQSAVSQQIAALEREAGARLVDRSARGVRLTDAGRALVRHTDVILARLSDAEAELEAIAGLRGGRVRLVSFASAGATLMPRAIALFRERHPAVELSLEPAEPEEAAAKLRAGDADIALTIDAEFCSVDDDGVELLHIVDDPMYVVLPRDHPLAAKPRIRLEELRDDAWLAGSQRGCPDTMILLRACGAAGFEPRIAFHSDDYLAIQGFVAAGVGVSLIPDLALLAVRDDVVIRALATRPPVRRIQAATLRDGYKSPAIEAMLGTLAEVGREFEAQRQELALAS